MTLYNAKRFTVPATGTKRKTPCAVHHFVKGECLRCDEKIRKTVDAASDLKETSIDG